MKRVFAEEIMDDPGQDMATFESALKDLDKLNRIAVSHLSMLGFLDRLVTERGLTRLSLLDVGAGGGQQLRQVAAWGAKRGVELELCGLDRSPWSKTYNEKMGTPAEWLACDLFDLPAHRRFDVVMCNIFTHHLDDPTMVRFLQWLPRHTRLRWLILDVHRHWIPWVVIWAGTRMLRLHPMVSHDGPVSIRRSFVRADLEKLVAEAGVEARIRWLFPFRWSVDGPGSEPGDAAPGAASPA